MPEKAPAASRSAAIYRLSEIFSRMKPSYLLPAIPIVFFFMVAATVNFAPLLRFYSDYDLTSYLCAKSIAEDFDIAYTRADSDRFFREELFRPSRFFVKTKQIISSSGTLVQYFVFYSPDLYTFALVPFVKIFSFRGIFVLNAFLIGVIYILGSIHFKDSRNAVVYYSIGCAPFLFLIPSHHLFLFAAVSTSVFLALQRRTALSAVSLAIAVSSQFWSILFAPFFLHYWKTSGEKTGKELRFVFSLLVCVLIVWGIQAVMYPEKAVSETRWILDLPDRPLAEVWNQLPVANAKLVTYPEMQRLSDLVFGRTIGVFVYGFAGCAMILAAIWQWRQTFVRSTLLFLLLLFCAVVLSDPIRWNFRVFAGDFLVLLTAVAFFLFPLFSTRTVLLGVLLPSLFFAGPLLANPFGAVGDRYYYLQTFPYRFFPVELSLVGKIGRTAKSDYQLNFKGGTVYFLNDSFYHDQDFFWIRGESKLEFLLRQDPNSALSFLRIQSGSVDDRITLTIGGRKEEFRLGPNESAYVKLANFQKEERTFEGKRYLHGKIESKNGYAPKLLSRENPDYRYLGCQIHLITNFQGEITQ